MLRKRNLSVLVGVALILFCVGAAAQAKPTNPSRIALNKSMLTTGSYTASQSIATPTTLDQLVDSSTITAGVSVACSYAGFTTPNQWLRRYDLDGAYGISGPFTVTSVTYGVETADGTFLTPPDPNASPGVQTVTVRTYCIGNAETQLFYGFNLIPTGTDVDFLQPDEDLAFETVAKDGVCTGATDDLVVEVAAYDCFVNFYDCDAFFIGANSSGESAPGYIAADQCGIVNPVTLADIGFPTDNVIIVVDGDANPEGGGGGVPALNTVGALLMLLVLLGTSAFFVARRRVTN
jgi:hypothetical protein